MSTFFLLIQFQTPLSLQKIITNVFGSFSIIRPENIIEAQKKEVTIFGDSAGIRFTLAI